MSIFNTCQDLMMTTTTTTMMMN